MTLFVNGDTILERSPELVSGSKLNNAEMNLYKEREIFLLRRNDKKDTIESLIKF